MVNDLLEGQRTFKEKKFPSQIFIRLWLLKQVHNSLSTISKGQKCDVMRKKNKMKKNFKK